MSSGWTARLSDIADKQLKKLDRTIQKRVLNYLEERLEGCKNPRHFGEPLKGSKSGLWRYRIGDYRVICELLDDQVLILALTIGPRREVYK